MDHRQTCLLRPTYSYRCMLEHPVTNAGKNMLQMFHVLENELEVQNTRCYSLSPKHEAVYGTFSFVFMISFKTEKRSSFENSGVFNTSIVLP